MSLSASLANALTGLTASARAAAVVSSNVSNALTPGYVRRTAEVSALVLGGEASGVSVEAIRREVKPLLLGERRGAAASASAAEAQADFLRAVETALAKISSAEEFQRTMSALREHLATTDDAVKRMSRPRRVVFEETH